MTDFLGNLAILFHPQRIPQKSQADAECEIFRYIILNFIHGLTSNMPTPNLQNFKALLSSS